MLEPNEITLRVIELNKKDKELQEERKQVREEIIKLIEMFPISYKNSLRKNKGGD